MEVTESLPVGAIQQVSQLINTTGASAVILAIILVCFLMLFLSLIKRNNATEKAIQENLDAIRVMNDHIGKIFTVLEDHSKALKILLHGITDEISDSQLQEVADMLFQVGASKTISYVEQVVSDNHLTDTQMVKLKLENISSNIYSLAREKMVHFKYKGQSLSLYLNSKFKNTVYETMNRVIYRASGYDYKLAKSDVLLTFENMKSEFMDLIFKSSRKA